MIQGPNGYAVVITPVDSKMLKTDMVIWKNKGMVGDFYSGQQQLWLQEAGCKLLCAPTATATKSRSDRGPSYLC
jgi:hypothetical protein